MLRRKHLSRSLAIAPWTSPWVSRGRTTLFTREGHDRLVLCRCCWNDDSLHLSWSGRSLSTLCHRHLCRAPPCLPSLPPRLDLLPPQFTPNLGPCFIPPVTVD